MKLAILLCIASASLVSSECGIHIPKEHPQQAGRHERAVIGGNMVPEEKWPWQISLQSDVFCGGTVVSDRWVLTAAHCAYTEGDYDVHMGVTHRFAENGTMAKVIERKVHPSYVKGTGKNDIALLKLNTPLTFNHLVSPICLPNLSQSIPDDGQAVATGFGTANNRSTNEIVEDETLRETIVPIINQNVCEQLLHHKLPGGQTDFSQYTIVCAGSIGHSTASGDSGGPLMMKSTDGRWFQIGIASFAAEAQLSADGIFTPGGFTDVRKYCDWIADATGGNVKCQEETVTMQDVKIPE